MANAGEFVGARLRWTAAVSACVLLAACTVARSDGPAHLGLFRADGRLAAGVAPGPRAVWYAAERPRYFEIGLADWRDAPRARSGWRRRLARLFRRRAGAQGYPEAVIDAHASLPLPSIVEVANLQTGASVRVRIDQSARLHGELVSLPAALAERLGVRPDRAVMVRVRYAAPALALRDAGALRLAWIGSRHAAPAAPAAALAQAAPAAPRPVLAAAPAAQKLAVATPQRSLQIALRGPLAAVPPRNFGGFEVQAGAFADADNARRAAARLAAAGAARIDSLRRGGRTLYRVVVTGAASPEAARRLRARVAELGFPEAMVRSE